MLHTVNKSPFQNGTLESCLRFVQPGDPILLLEDGVVAAVKGTAKSQLVQQAMAKNPVYVINADLKARGVADRVMEGVNVVGYDVFVDLVEQHTTHAWL
jgi:tRNA 2-thiouridine synthesizing protein B